MAIVTISRQLGTMGTEIAHALAEELHYNYLDKESFAKALQEHGISGMHLEKYDEKKPALWDVFSSDRERYLLFLKMAIYEFARKGNAVIVGRGGQVLLKNLPGSLSVRIEAPLDVRRSRIQQKMGCDAKQAEHLIRNSDHNRIGYHRFFFNVDWEESCIYDLILNTKTLSLKSAVRIIREACEVEEIKNRLEEARSELENLTLSQRVEARILYEEEVPIQYLEVVADSGVVTLRGAVTTMNIADRCVEIARAVEGAKEVVNEFSLINYYGMM